MDKRSLLNALTVENIWELVVDNPTSIGPDASLPELLEAVVEDTRTRHVYVVDEQRQLIGVVRLTTVTGLLFPKQVMGSVKLDFHLFRHVNLGGKTVREVMNTKPRSVRPDTQLDEVARILLRERITELPVVDAHNKLIGQVNMYEIVKAYLQLRRT